MPESQATVLPGLNPEQSKQLYQFLNNLTRTSQQQHQGQESLTTPMAGMISASTTIYDPKAICCLYKLESGAWILDSGASDHMSSSANTLYDL